MLKSRAREANQLIQTALNTVALYGRDVQYCHLVDKM